MGHSDLKTTMVYMHPDGRIKDIIDRRNESKLLQCRIGWDSRASDFLRETAGWKQER
jgi:hypothetical protein